MAGAKATEVGNAEVTTTDTGRRLCDRDATETCVRSLGGMDGNGCIAASLGDRVKDSRGSIASTSERQLTFTGLLWLWRADPARR